MKPIVNDICQLDKQWYRGQDPDEPITIYGLRYIKAMDNVRHPIPAFIVNNINYAMCNSRRETLMQKASAYVSMFHAHTGYPSPEVSI